MDGDVLILTGVFIGFGSVGGGPNAAGPTTCRVWDSRGYRDSYGR